MYTLQQIAADRASRSQPRQMMLPEPQRQSMLRSLASAAGTGFETLGLVLDTPGALVRGALVGDPLSALNWNFDDRVSGSELLDAYGLKAPKTLAGSKFLGSAARFGTGLAAEIALDPFWFTKFGTAAKSLSGRVLGKTQYADDIQRYAAQKLIDEPLDAARRNQEFLWAGNPVQAEAAFVRDRAGTFKGGQAVLNALDANDIPLTTGMRDVAPPVGPRVARATTTPADILRLTPDADKNKVLSDISQAAEGLGTTFDEIKDMPLGGLASVGAFGFETTFNPKGGLKYLDALDALTARVKYSAPVVRAAQLFQKGVDQAPSLRGQLMALQKNRIAKPLRDEMAVQIATHTAYANAANRAFQQNDAAKQLLKTDTLLTQEGNNALTRIVEGVPTAEDETLLRLVPELQKWSESWSGIRDDLFERKNSLGIDVSEFNDPFGVQWSPRIAEEAELLGRRAKLDTMAYGTAEASDQFGRTVFTPGGQMDIREMSADPVIQQWSLDLGKNRGMSQSEQKDYVLEWLRRKYGGIQWVPNVGAYRFLKRVNPQTGERLYINRGQLGRISGLLRRYDPQYFKDLPDSRQTPIFSAFPTIAQARGMRSAAQAIGNAEFVYETLADSAVMQRKATIAGAGYRRLDETLDDVTKQLGLARKMAQEVGDDLIPAGPADQVVDNLKDRLLRVVSQSQPGFTKDSLDLSQFSVPESVANALTERIQTFIPESRKKEAAGFLDSFTALFKNTVLARPARFARDFLSNGLSVWFETGSFAATARGFANAQKLLAGNYDDAAEYIRSLPRYKNLQTTEQVVDQVAKDIARTQLLSGVSSADLARRNSTLALSEYYPGADPRTLANSLGEMVKGFTPTADRGATDILKDLTRIRGVGFFADAPSNTANPFFKASEEIGDTVDSWGRLGGFFALLETGNTVEQAAKRMKSALVDYSSLTNFERDRLVKFWFPWWAYNSRIGAYVTQSLTEDPGGRYAQTVRFFNNLQGQNEDGYVPTSIRQNIGLNLNPVLNAEKSGIDAVIGAPLNALFGSPKAGVERFATGFDVPGFDLAGTMAFQPNSLVPDMQGTARNIGLQLSPPLRMFAEAMSGRDTFTGRELADADTTANRVYRYFAGPGRNLSGPTKLLASNIPQLQFFEPFVRPFTDTRIDPADRLRKFLINYLLPIKAQDIDLGYRIDDQIRALEPTLRGTMRTFQRQYVPADRKATLTPEELLGVYLYQDLQNMKTEYNKQGRPTR